MQVEGGQDKQLNVTGKLPEARCRFTLSEDDTDGVAPAGDTTGCGNAGNTSPPVVEFGQVAIGVLVTRTVTLQNLGRCPAVFSIDYSDVEMVSRACRTH